MDYPPPTINQEVTLGPFPAHRLQAQTEGFLSAMGSDAHGWSSFVLAVQKHQIFRCVPGVEAVGRSH